MLNTATSLAEKLDISRSYLYFLKDSGAFNLNCDSDGKILWDDYAFQQFSTYLNTKRNKKKDEPSNDKTDEFHINNRRYLGNKYKLLAFIRETVDENCRGIETVADIFAGTGSVASAFLDKKVITNDNMFSNYICHVAWFGNEDYSQEKVRDIIAFYNEVFVEEDNYMSLNFANTYFSENDCKRIGFIREDIEKRYRNNDINERERALLITSLIYAMDKIANTCGHYDAYRQGAEYTKTLKLLVPEVEANQHANNMCFNMDANELVKCIEADLVYIDPPYNSRQYCDAYHLLENVARWEKPTVKGVAKKMDRDYLKSDYCTKKAPIAFEELINNIKAKYILLSYNNMAVKGNDRSNAKISDEDIFRILEKKGKVQVFSLKYKAFTTGKSDITDNEERLFLCECTDYKKTVIATPFNYTGGKFKLLDQLLPLFPPQIDKVVDLFCGGCNVGINVNCNNVTFNDDNGYLMGMIKSFSVTEKHQLLQEIRGVIEKYGLSNTSENGYEFYNCDSGKGLADYNKEPFLKLREDFNNYKRKDYYYYVLLFTLLVFSFNNQLRFNKKGKFNLPVGKRDFNPKMQKKLIEFVDRIQCGNYTFSCEDYRSLDMSDLTSDSLVYADPPYLITCATYNEQNGWNEEDERDLLALLDELNKNKVKFALSNVLESKGKENSILKAWLNSNEDYVIHYLNKNYSNSNYHKKDRSDSAVEVLITNY